MGWVRVLVLDLAFRDIVHPEKHGEGLFPVLVRRLWEYRLEKAYRIGVRTDVLLRG